MRKSVRLALVAGSAAAGILVAIPVSQMIAVALTRAQPRADCAVVLGARVYDDGTPSLALSDRVDEAVRLLHAGRVRRLLMSGGRDDANGISEAAVMRKRALDAGVADEAVLVDELGVNTAATARNAVRILKEHGLATALLVTHYFHGPRTRLLFRREGGAFQVAPARMTRHLVREPWYVLREVIGYWAVLLHLA